jgi:hypothetical protein
MPNRRGINIKTETLLRYLARDARNERVRLRAIELLMMMEGTLRLDQMSKPQDANSANGLAGLIGSESPANSEENGPDEPKTSAEPNARQNK